VARDSDRISNSAMTVRSKYHIRLLTQEHISSIRPVGVPPWINVTRRAGADNYLEFVFDVERPVPAGDRTDSIRFVGMADDGIRVLSTPVHVRTISHQSFDVYPKSLVIGVHKIGDLVYKSIRIDHKGGSHPNEYSLSINGKLMDAVPESAEPQSNEQIWELSIPIRSRGPIRDIIRVTASDRTYHDIEVSYVGVE
jgi:hypothetical protein